MTTLSFKPPLQHVCLLRLSAIGDTCHALAALRAFQDAWPQARFTWIIGKLEAKLMTEIVPEIEFITFDKAATLRELWRLRTALHGRRFDLLLDMQLSLRASMVSRLIDAPIKLGFDRQRARELQWLFTNAKIEPATSEHVLDSFMGFARACGIEPAAPHWDVKLPQNALDYAHEVISDSRPTLLISPCSSHTARNWSAERYAAVADHAASVHHMRVVLVGTQFPGGTDGCGDCSRSPRAPRRSNRQGHAAAIVGSHVAKHGAVVARLRAGAYGRHGRVARRRPVRRHQSAACRPIQQPSVVRR
jgi:heptosyltransferase I